MERAKRRHIQKCVKESSAEQIMNRLFKIFWDTVKEGHDPTAFSQKAWGSCTTYTACFIGIRPADVLTDEIQAAS